VLLDPELTSGSVCSRVPFDVNCNSVFIVDMAKLASPKDVLCDDMGAWLWKGSYRHYLSVDETGHIERIGNKLTETPETPYYRIWKRYYQNKSSKDLDKMVFTMEGTHLNVHIFSDTLN